LRQLGQPNLQAAPLLLHLTEAHLADGDTSGARNSAMALAELAETAGGDCLLGLAGLASGLVAVAEGENPVIELELAVQRLELARMSWEAARARLAMAEAVADANPELAIREARQAMATFRALGAAPGADRVRSLLRRLGVRSAAGPAVAGGLSRREEEVARLVGVGLSNDQIAARLFLSPRTVEHHITSILRKLPAAGRSGIAAHAVRHLDIAELG
jgi:DNA-binding CsgD family transcriptional regulator